MVNKVCKPRTHVVFKDERREKLIKLLLCNNVAFPSSKFQFPFKLSYLSDLAVSELVCKRYPCFFNHQQLQPNIHFLVGVYKCVAFLEEIQSLKVLGEIKYVSKFLL